MSGAAGDGTTEGRLLSLQTVLGRDVLAPVSVQSKEAISAPYVVKVETVSSRSSIDPDTLIFQPACLKIVQSDGGPRILHGMVHSLVAGGEPVRGRFSYSLTIVPKLWFMQQTCDCRIFTNVSIAEIVTKLCGEMGQTLDLKIYGDKQPKSYVTQYNESNFRFLSRMMQEAGYFYFFTHSESDHRLVVTDQNQGFPQPKTAMSVVHEGGGIDVLTEWRRTGATAAGVVHLADYTPLTPGSSPDASQPTTLGAAGAASRAVFEWPALADTQDAASTNARMHMEAAEAETGLIAAAGRNHRLAPGTRITIARDPFDAAQEVEYIVRSASGSGKDESWVGGDEGARYANRLVVFKSATPWREKISTPRPRMSGVHAAIVLGGEGEEIHADRYGRIKIRFFWDHRQDATADTTCWARVIQPWSGNSWGWQHLPRVGTEVAVAFLDGDPDRPVVIGGLYNGNMRPVFAIPGEQTKSGFRSRSTTQGDTSTFSELSFDDNKGQEKVCLHAEKDMTVEVEHDQTVTIDNSQAVTIKNGRKTKISAAGDQLTVDEGGITATATSGDIALKASGGSIKLDATMSIELTVGGNSIKIDASGITVSGIMVKLSGNAMVQVDAPMMKVSADGMMMLKGGIMMLN